jgi:hypothetical protein
MLAVRVKGQVTEDRELIVKIPDDLPPGPVEVIVLREEVKRRRGVKRRAEVHPLFGMWADRPDMDDPVQFVTALRRKIERREDGSG